MIYLLAYILASVMLNKMIDLRFIDRSGAWPQMDAFLTLLFFKILWPIGLIIFVIMYYRGRGSIE
ncbi:hypothetical protein LCGC14_1549000 [marine sediment metagenome]|uniref:Uncharacterized protein n=1 Tax=marine sediment metagenome TaxID=412755 RepID=A0A0F9IQV5_9ZZZZ